MKITLVGINLVPVQNMGDVYRSDAAESKYGNEIAPSPTTFGTGAFEFKNHIFI
jgi:hypothetical protein